MPYYIEKDTFILVHAGLNLMLDDPLSDKETMLWANDNSIMNQAWLGNRIIVHGHRIRTRQRIQKNIQGLHTFPVIGIDNGCVYPYEDYHHLCAVELTSMELYFQENIDI
jgi:serine/threonine protein phosphatase 1